LSINITNVMVTFKFKRYVYRQILKREGWRPLRDADGVLLMLEARLELLAIGRVAPAVDRGIVLTSS